MLSVLVLVCSIAVTPDLRDCVPANARVVMPLPTEYSNPTLCFVHGQAYLAGTSIGRTLDDSDRVKILCKDSRTIAALLAGRN